MLTVVAGVHMGASRGGIVITIDQQALVGELTLHRHDLVLAVISLHKDKIYDMIRKDKE